MRLTHLGLLCLIALACPLTAQADDACIERCKEQCGGKMSGLYGLWDDSTETLIITRPTGQQIKVKGRGQILVGGFKVFGVETVGDEIHVLTGPKGNRTPNRRVRFNDGGFYKGTSGL